MNYQIKQWPAFSVMEVSRKVKTAEAFEVVSKLWENSWKDGIWSTGTRTMSHKVNSCKY